MSKSQIEEEFALKKFYQQLIRPEAFKGNQLLANKNQVAGHAGFYSLQGEPSRCLKPFNTKCVRGRREHLFYQLIEYFKSNLNSETSSPNQQTNNETIAPLYYKHFTLLTHPGLATKCNCIIDGALIKLLSSYVANFYHVKHMSHSVDEFENNSPIREQFLNSVYSEQLSCPCYGRDPKEKASCARDYDKIDFLCLEDLTAHCREPCIIDIKIGQITYDPMAIKEKVLEQSSKYRRLREFGFRILGMRLGDEIKDKTYGKTLETTEQVFAALDSFFMPLNGSRYKCAVISQILNRLQGLLAWFEAENINQLKFFSSSILIVYDSFIKCKYQPTNIIEEELANNVRVSMIDFAHVFHVHSSTTGVDGALDNNYIFGLRKLERFFVKLNHHHHHQLHPQPAHPPPGLRHS